MSDCYIYVTYMSYLDIVIFTRKSLYKELGAACGWESGQQLSENREEQDGAMLLPVQR